jgi:glycosyltransferase involved in cell wall biosynthesis
MIKIVHIMTIPEGLIFLCDQPHILRAKGFEVHVLASPGDFLAKFAEQEQVIAHAVPMQRKITPLQDLRALFQIWQCLQQLRPQIVHAHTPKGGLLGTVAAWLAGVPVRIYHIHGLPLETATGYRYWLLYWSEKMASWFANQVLCVSHSVCNQAVLKGLCPASKIEVLLQGSINGVDAIGTFNAANLSVDIRQNTRGSYGIPADALVIGFVGRVVKDKGLIELAAAWKILREEFPSLHWLVVGPIEPQDPIPTDVASALHHDPRIHLTGALPNIAPLYAAMDVLVLPTYREGLGTVLLEAAAMELPTIATRIPGCVDAVLDRKTGVLIPPRNVTELVEAIRLYLQQPALRLQHGQAGRQWVLQNFHPPAIQEALYQKYRQCLQAVRLLPPEVIAQTVEGIPNVQ